MVMKRKLPGTNVWMLKSVVGVSVRNSGGVGPSLWRGLA